MATTISNMESDRVEVIIGRKSSKYDQSTMEWIREKNLGRGSYGVVDLVKIIRTPISCVPAAVKRSPVPFGFSLEKEFRVLQRFLGCPNIVQVYDGDMIAVQAKRELTTEDSVTEGNVFVDTKLEEVAYYNFFLEYAPGGDLRRLMKKYGGKIPEYRVRCYTRMIVEGLRDIHKRGYVHCDLKPANILVFPSRQYGKLITTLKIADFGLAKEPGEEDDDDDPWVTFRGTLNYMSPESVKEGKTSAALDIWSLGCVVVEMMTGEEPWVHAGMGRRDLKFEIAFSNDTPYIPQNISTTGRDFLSKCFARDPDDRWSADELISHLFLSTPPGF